MPAEQDIQDHPHTVGQKKENQYPDKTTAGLLPLKEKDEDEKEEVTGSYKVVDPNRYIPVPQEKFRHLLIYRRKKTATTGNRAAGIIF